MASNTRWCELALAWKIRTPISVASSLLSRQQKKHMPHTLKNRSYRWVDRGVRTFYFAEFSILIMLIASNCVGPIPSSSGPSSHHRLASNCILHRLASNCFPLHILHPTARIHHISSLSFILCVNLTSYRAPLLFYNQMLSRFHVLVDYA
jgi:hypothetical protein